MNPRPLVAGLTRSLLLPASALLASAAIASPVPLIHPAAAREARSLSPPAISSGERTALPLAASDAADGTWQEFHLLQVQGPLMVQDQAHDQLLSLGGYYRTDAWALPLAGPPVWQPLPWPAPPFSFDPFASVQDPSTGLVYFLAHGAVSIEMHTLDPQTGAVAVIPASGTPPWWLYGAPVFDPVNQRLIVFSSGPFYDGPEVWVLDLLPAPAWSLWTPSGTPPPPLTFLPALLDPVRRHMLLPRVYGSGPLEMWALTLDGPPEWLHFPTDGLPDGAPLNPVVYDPPSDRMWTIDGLGEPYSLSLETYQWSPVLATGPGPSPRRGAGLAIDPVRHRLLVGGGVTPSGDDTHSDTWAMSLDDPRAWAQLVPDVTRPPIRGGASDGYDASRHRLVVFGGSDEVGGFRNDTWVLDLGPTPLWSPLATEGSPPPRRYWHVSAWDEARDQLVVYGGYNGISSNPLGDLWALSFAGATPTWSPITPSGPAPVDRMLSQLVYDSGRDRFLLLCGFDGTIVLGDVWELRLAPTPAWRQLAPTGTPPARGAEMCVYDPGHDRVLMFGGGNPNGYMNDLWALDLGIGDGAWQQLSVPPGPSVRNLGLLRLDIGHDRLLLFGGYGLNDEGTTIEYLNDSWALDLAPTPAWQRLSPAGFRPPGRDRANGTYDPRHDRLVLACGGISGSNDVWALAFGDTPTPTLLALASRDVTADRVRLVWAGAEPGTRATAYRREPDAEWRFLGTLLADGEGMVTLEDRDLTPGTTVEYRLGVMIEGGETFFGATVVQVPPRTMSLSASVVGGHASFTLELPSGDPATLSLFDLAGRRMWSRSVGELGAGSHEVSADDVALPAALYFARLTQGSASRFARVLIVR
jgi:Kelch motif protein/galactose oxidase-like protein